MHNEITIILNIVSMEWLFLLSMNPFVVSARKYRPSTFASVVGQSHITTTLKNAIRTSHLAQAFLFCGPRGVGKTTCARILAKTLNCRQLTPEFEACNTCESCLSFNNGQSLNIYELDAASNNSVDDIRNLVEQVRYAPHAGEYKIYIIDEVHMLSTSAFNAFLKTLEEPPSYAIFILATTEKHKIIPTILSRCQIFDFNRIQVEDIASHLAYVAKSESVEAEEEALHIIAQKADGALRDALSIFDQIVSFAGNRLTYKDVINNLSILDYDYYFKVADQILDGDIPGVLVTFNELIHEGFDGHHFINGLASHFRDLLVSRDVKTLPLLEVSKGTRDRYAAQCGRFSQALLLRMLSVCSQCDLDFRSARNQRLHVELALIRMCSMATGQDIHSSPQLPPSPAPLSTPVGGKPATVSTPVRPSEAPLQPAPSPVRNTAEDSIPAVPSSAAAVPPTTEKKLPAPVQGSTPSASPVRSVSLSAIRKPEVRKDDPAPSATAPSQPDTAEVFSEQAFQDCWNEYASQVHQQGKLQLHTTLTMNRPIIGPGFEIQLSVHNPSQEALLQEEKPELLAWLRKKLNNFSITLVTVQEENPDMKDQAFTNKEKYRKMVETNPHLDDFRKQLGLELDM